MDRLACVNVPEFPLQILLKQHPQWVGQPAAVVDVDRPQGKILWADVCAQRCGVLPGLRYAQALALTADLRAGVVSLEAVHRETEQLVSRLNRFSPQVDFRAEMPGAFWLSGAGLRTLFGSASAWGRAMAEAMTETGFPARVVVGFSRFGTYAVAQQGQPLVIFSDYAAEQRATDAVPLARLGVTPQLRAQLHALGIETVGAYRALPQGGLLLRFGKEAATLHALANGTQWDPLQPQLVLAPIEEQVLLDDPEHDVTRLLFLIKGALSRALKTLASRHQALSVVVLQLRLDGGSTQEERLEPTEATLDERLLLRLIQLRLESSPPRAAVREIRLGAESVEARAEQLALFALAHRRDVRAADAAIAQLRAEFGNQAVQRAVLRDGHLPEAQFAWEPLLHLELPKPRLESMNVLVRRVFAQKTNGVAPRPKQIHGSYVVSGGWWRSEIVREYVFSESEGGELKWLYYDVRRQRWFVQGLVE